MTGPARDEQPTRRTPADLAEQARRSKRRAHVFGDVLPDATSDERSEGDTHEGVTDEWLRRQVPPHHG